MDPNTIAPIQKTSGKSEQPASTNRSSAEPDRVSLSKETREMQRAEAERVTELSRLISSGEYEIDLEKLAAAFVLKELL